MTSHCACPIWEATPSVQDIPEVGIRHTSPRAGGRFVLKQSGAACLHRLSDRQKANLSYWLYRHNLEYRLFDEQPSGGDPPVLNQEWVEGNRDRIPSTSERMPTFLRELIRCDDAGQEPHEELQKAAGGCRHDQDLKELRLYAMGREWLRGGGNPDSPSFPHPDLIDLDLGARIHVEEQLGEQGRGQQGFVAMWFDDSLDKVYDCGIKSAIEAAGYEARRIDQTDFVGGVVDEIMAEIRKSRFVVADFTTSPESGARGGVYFEAGFAYGLNIPVFITCHKDRTEAVHFDIGHLNRLEWETSGDLREKLKNRIEAVLGRGPVQPPVDGGRSGQEPPVGREPLWSTASIFPNATG